MTPPRFTLRWTNVKKWTRFGQASQSRPIFDDNGHAMSYQEVVAKLNELAELAGSQILPASDGVAEPE